MKLSLRLRLILLSVLPLMLTTVVLTGVAVYEVAEIEREQTAQLEQDLIAEKRKELEGFAELAFASISDIDETDADARDRVLARIARLTFGNDRHFFVMAHDGRVVLHPDQPDLEGQPVSSVVDMDGQRYLETLLVGARQHAAPAHVSYRVPRFANPAPAPMLAHAIDLPRWNWVIGTGIATDDIDREVAHAHAKIAAKARQTLRYFIAVGVGILLLTGATSVGIARQINRRLAAATDVANGIAAGRLDNTLPAPTADEIGRLLSSLESMQTQLRERDAADRIRNGTTERLKQGLDKVSANVMLASTDGEIVYINEAASALFQDIEDDAQKTIAGFDAARILGSNIDHYHKNPAHQRALLAGLRETHRGKLNLGDRTLLINANPVIDANGERLGIVVEWIDVTDQVLQEASLRREAEEERTRAIEMQRKVDAVLDVVAAASTGDLTRKVRVSGDDAIGQVGTALARFLESLRRDVGEIGGHAGSLSTSADSLSEVSRSMRVSTESTMELAEDVASASEQVSNNIETVAAAAEEMTASIREISQQTVEAARIAGNAVNAANAANTTVRQLGESSAAIDHVVKAITAIAEQTNLLALNATIEAARAGEAGKGFAVVANEVKELAKETGIATEDIRQKIATIQRDSDDAAGALGQISDIIEAISATQTTVASAVEQQTATANEISRNVSEAAVGSGDIARKIATVATGIQEAMSGIGDSDTAAGELTRMASELHQLVGAFRYEARADEGNEPGGTASAES